MTGQRQSTRIKSSTSRDRMKILIIFLTILGLTSISASDVRLNTDRAKQEQWLAEVNTLLCAKVNACNGVIRDSINHPYVYTYMCCAENEKDRNRFDCSDSCRFETTGIVAHFYYSGLTPLEAVDEIIALKKRHG